MKIKTDSSKNLNSLMKVPRCFLLSVVDTQWLELSSGCTAHTRNKKFIIVHFRIVSASHRTLKAYGNLLV